MMTNLSLALIVTGVLSADAAEAPILPRNVLYLTTSEAFAHSVIVRKDGEPSHSEKILKPLFEKMGATFTATKDASVINADNLKNYDLIIFYTQGDLTKPNKEEAPVMAPGGVDDLLAWIRGGGRFMGLHAATDTFDGDDEETVAPFIEMIGAEFQTHGKQFVGTVKLVDPGHPAVAGLPETWTFNEEWYVFRKWNKDALRVLALLDPGAEREKQEMYNVPAYPVIWVRTFGEGRVYYSALGHREDVWTNSTFQTSLISAVKWLMDKGDPQAEPNFAQVVPAKP